MPKSFHEEYIRFVFEDSWDVEKYDGHIDTRSFVGALENRKAMDFVGTHADIGYLIEIKDYRRFRIENKEKFNNGMLQRHIACKVHDTLAGLVLAHRKVPVTTCWRNVLAHCRRNQNLIRIVLWLEDDKLFHGQQGKAAANVFTKELKAALRWVPASVHVIVVNREYNAGALPDVTAINLPRPP